MVEPERDASMFDMQYYDKLLKKAWDEIAFVFGMPATVKAKIILHPSLADKNDINSSNGEGLKGNINTFKDTRNFRDKRSRARLGG